MGNPLLQFFLLNFVALLIFQICLVNRRPQLYLETLLILLLQRLRNRLHLLGHFLIHEIGGFGPNLMLLIDSILNTLFRLIQLSCQLLF